MSVFIPFAATVLAGFFSLAVMVRWKRSEIILAERIAGELSLDFELRAGGTGRGLERLPRGLQPLVDIFLPWRISGVYKGQSAWIYPEIRSAGKSAKTFLVVKVYFPTPLPFEFRAGRETVLTKLGKTFFSLSDVEVGDWAFDKSVRIKADDPAAVGALFSRSEPRDALLSLLSAFPEAFADRESVRWERAAVRSLFDLVPEALDALAAFSAALEKVRA